jgi:hypothetical protein
MWRGGDGGGGGGVAPNRNVFLGINFADRQPLKSQNLFFYKISNIN